MYQRLLVPLDGSETSRLALASALKLAQADGGRVRLMHVLEEVSYSGFDLYAANAGDLMKILCANGQRILDEGMAAAKEAGVPADFVLHDTFGQRLADVVADAAKRWSADVIVVGTHGRRGVDRLMMGSGAEQIIRLAPVPVLVIRAPVETAEAVAA